MAPDERRHVGVVGTVGARGEELEIAEAGGALGGRGGEVAGGDAIHVKRELVVVDENVEGGGLEGKREAVVGREFVVHREPEGGALRIFTAVTDGKGREVRAVERGVGEGDAVGGGLGPAPGVLDEGLAGVLAVEAGGEGEAEGFADGGDVGDIRAGVDLTRGMARGRGAVPIAGVVAHHHVGAEIAGGAGAFEGAARDEIHGAGEGAALGFGRGGKRDLDAGEVVDRDLVEADGAIGAAGAATDGAGEAEAIEGDGHVVAGDAVEGDIAGVAAGVVDVHAGEKLDELGHVTFGDVAEFVGGDDLADVGGEALLVDGAGGAAHLARGGDDELGEGNGAGRSGGGGRGGGGEGEVVGGRGAGTDGEGGDLGGQAGVENLDLVLAGREVGEAVETVGVGEGLEGGAEDAEADAFKVVAGGGVLHAALDAGGGCGDGGCGGGRSGGLGGEGGGGKEGDGDEREERGEGADTWQEVHGEGGGRAEAVWE